MNTNSITTILRSRFEQFPSPVHIPLQRRGTFLAKMTEEGIEVDNLSTQPLLPWIVFEETLNLLNQQGGRAERGDAMSCRLGETGLPFNSIEGHIAHVVYGKKVGEAVFRRISPIAAILVWAGLCEAAPGELRLHLSKRE